ncbi:unnamed protein product [Schistosoma spindalis]|nr:unnamed protein product [Schistosoma spindale]
MEDMKTRRTADIAPDHNLVVIKKKLKLTKHCATVGTASQRFKTAFHRDTDKHNEFKITQQQVPSLTGSTEGRRNYHGGQLKMNQRNTSYNVSGCSGPQEASS